MKKNVIYLIGAQIVMWTVFTLSDYVDETTNNDTFMLLVMYFPAVLSIVYLFLENKLYDSSKMSRIKCNLILVALLLVMNITIGFVIVTLACDDEWIVYQHNDGWENFLNGIEYAIMGIWGIVMPIVIIGSWKLIMLLKRVLLHSDAKDEHKDI